MLQILGISYAGWLCTRWSTISIWCVYALDMGVCASSGSVGFWPIIPAALRSQLRSHAHIWHSFPDMITIHLPLRFFGYAEYFHHSPSGTGATFQKWNNSPPAPLYSLLFIPPLHPVSLPPHCLLILFASSTDSCCLAIGILCYKPFPPWVSCLCLPARSGHLAATSLQWPPARIGKEREGCGEGERGGIRTGQMRGAAVGLSHYCGFALHCFVWAFMLCIHSKTSWWRAGCWLLRNSWSSWGVFFLRYFFFSFSHAVWCLTSDPQSVHYMVLENKMILLQHSS